MSSTNYSAALNDPTSTPQKSISTDIKNLTKKIKRMSVKDKPVQNIKASHNRDKPSFKFMVDYTF